MQRESYKKLTAWMEQTKPPAKLVGGLRFQVIFLEKRRCKKGVNADPQALTQLMDDPQLHRVIGAVHNIADGGFGDATFHIQLILCHISFVQQLQKALADCLVQSHFRSPSLSLY